MHDRSNTSARRFTFDPDGHGEVVIEDVVWWRWLGRDLYHIDAVDPDQGPMIWIGMAVGQHRLTAITRMEEETAASSRLVVSFSWEPVQTPAAPRIDPEQSGCWTA